MTTKIKDQVTLTFGSIELTGDLHLASYENGETAAVLFTDEGTEHISTNLIAYGFVAQPGQFFVKDYSEHEGLAQSIVDAGLGTITQTITFGPLNLTAYEIALEA